ncbi:Rpg1p [Sugiyamaella lignohabitans]|uniref:Eukaryotic translation initiation factor 3 subunit A n=1 Tax=Sugiyamaella lignohabitans TaxID=796027 RepID=A0A170R049_9ASCO|nr:Rpg1p [Sugiyamaella lignohabitans]ANB16033.1 Rpg1p [Sugiyamaella lignohabitans]
MAPFARPENVLKRAEELIHVDQSAAALDLLYETISSKRSRNVSIDFLEPIILRFAELSVELRKGKIIKDGLHQYKKIIQLTSIGSIEIVVKRFLELAEAKVTDAQVEADKIDADDDLEAEDSPEDILLSTVSSEQTKDRTDRELVTPWLKFLWEAYRSVLDVLRNNSKLEVLYQQVVHQAFSFCLKYTRKTEFRRLCELLRSHLQSASGQYKNAGALNPIDLSDADTLQRYLDTRFEQLNIAVKLELWQEAFRSVEDVHTLLTVSKRPAKVSTMASYYENLARIFSVSGNNLYHAAAWSRFYSLVLQARSVPESELVRIASLLLVSVLAIPPRGAASATGNSYEIDDQKHRNTRLSGLLNLTKTPTRESLLASALSKNVLAHVRPEIRDLYKILEVDFHPLSIKKRLGPVVDKIGSDPNYQPYIKPLYQVILTRLFQQLSQVYKTVKLDFVISLASFPAPFNASRIEIERFIVMGCHKGEFGIILDHESSSITFRDDVNLKSAPSSNYSGASALQPTPAEIIRSRLSNLAKSLFSTVSVVDPMYIDYKLVSRQAAIERALAGLEEDNVQALARKDKIETRQKNAELEQIRREEEEAKNRALQIQQEQAAEQQRLADEQRKRELERIKREQDSIKEEEKRKIAEEINSKGIIKIDVNNLEDLDTNKLRSMQVEQLAKENKDLNERLRIIGRRMDHLERAYRLEEIEFWEKDAELQEQADIKAYEARKKGILIKSKQQYEEAVNLKARLERIVPDYEAFRAAVESKRRDQFEAKRARNQKLLEEEKKARIAKVRADREREQKRREAEERERAEQAARDAEREAEEKLRREEEEKKKAHIYRPGRLSAASGAASTNSGESASPAPAAAATTGKYVPGALRAASGSASIPASASAASAPASAGAAGSAASAPSAGRYVPGALRRSAGDGSAPATASRPPPASATSPASESTSSSTPAPRKYVPGAFSRKA